MIQWRENPMERGDIRGEIERRRKRPIDLNLRETLWTLYSAYLSRYVHKDDLGIVFPEIRATLERVSSHCVRFRIGETTYRVLEFTIGEPGTTQTITITLFVNEMQVFQFKMRETIRCQSDTPFSSEVMGEVTSFIEGPWVTVVPELLQKIREHEHSVQDKRQAQNLDHKLQKDMESFGLY
jgi:hypothetical protein